MSTSSQWANAVARDIGRLINGEISQEDFATAMAVATRDWTVSTSDIQELAAQVSSFLMRLQSFIVWDGPPPENIGGLGTWCMNRLTGDIYGPKTAAGWGEPAFSLVGPPGLSAKQIVISAGLLPEGATDAQFAAWLADAQIDKVQPLVDAAETARDDARQALADTGALADQIVEDSTPDITVTAVAGAPGTPASVVKGGTLKAPTFEVTVPRGADGEEVGLRASATHVQWRLGAGAWTDLVALADLAGADGREVQLQASATHIQWRYVGDTAWTNVVALSALTGPQGNAAWSPIYANVADGARRVQRVVDWTGGQGAKPATGKYLGPAGLVDTAAEATDIRGASGAGTGDMIGSNNLNDVADKAIARQNLSVWSRAEGDARYVTPSYVGSRGQNLVTNGSGILKNNTNFAPMVFNSADAFGSTGSFTDAVQNTTRETTELLPVDVSKTYRLSLYAKASPATGARNYIGIAEYDVDGLKIDAPHVMWSSPTTTLARDLKPGDTTIHLANAAGWETGSLQTYRRGIIAWNYINPGGRAWPEQTYSRNVWFDLWASDTSVNLATGVITLKAPWSGPAIPTGTKVSRSDAGGTYKYVAAGNVAFTDQWQQFTGVIGGTSTTGRNPVTSFTVATAAVKLVFLLNRDVAGSTAWLSNISFGIDYWHSGNFDPASKQDKLGFTPADAAAVTAALEAKADLVGGKVPGAQLPAPPTVPTFATVADVRAGKIGGKIVAPDAAAAAMALVPLTDAATVVIDLDTGPNFTLLTTAGVGVGRTIGAPTNGNVGQYYTVRFTAHAGATVAWNTAFKWPGGKVEAIANTAGAVTEVAFKMISAARFDVVGFAKDIR